MNEDLDEHKNMLFPISLLDLVTPCRSEKSAGKQLFRNTMFGKVKHMSNGTKTWNTKTLWNRAKQSQIKARTKYKKG